MNYRMKPPGGFVLIEALIALVIVGVVLLGLEGSLTLIVRSLADAERQATATRLAETRRELLFASACAPNSGSDSVNAVSVIWTASPVARLTHITQTSTYPQKLGSRIEQYDAIGACQ